MTTAIEQLEAVKKCLILRRMEEAHRRLVLAYGPMDTASSAISEEAGWEIASVRMAEAFRPVLVRGGCGHRDILAEDVIDGRGTA